MFPFLQANDKVNRRLQGGLGDRLRLSAATVDFIYDRFKCDGGTEPIFDASADQEDGRLPTVPELWEL